MACLTNSYVISAETLTHTTYPYDPCPKKRCSVKISMTCKYLSSDETPLSILAVPDDYLMPTDIQTFAGEEEP